MPDTFHKDTWTKIAFGDVVRQVKDKIDPLKSGLKRYIAGEHMDTDDLKIRRWGTINEDYLGPAFHMRFKPGHILYGSRRTYLRKVAVPDFEGITANTTYVFESKDPKVLLPELLPFIMQTESFHQHSITQSKGSVNPYVNFSDLVWYEFALPPIEEQRRMADALLGVQQAVEAHKEAELCLTRLRDAMCIKLWNPKELKVPLVPLSQLSLKIQDGTHFSPQSNEGEFRYITSKNIRDGYLDISTAGWISRDEHENIYKRCDVRPGDLLLTKDGANAGNIAINTIEEPFSLLSSVAFIRPNLKRLDPTYAFEYLRSCVGRTRLLAHVKGSAITRLTLTQIREFKIPALDLDVQKQHAAKLSQIQSCLDRLSDRQFSLATIGSSIQQLLEER